MGVFTIGMTIPIAVIMGLWMFKSHAGKITVTGPSIFGVVLFDWQRNRGPLGSTEWSGDGADLHTASDYFPHGNLWPGGFGPSSVAGSRASLSLDLCQAGHDRRAGDRRVCGSSQHPIS